MSRKLVVLGLAILACLAGCATRATVYVVRHGEAWTNVTAPNDMKESEKDKLTIAGQAQATLAGKSLTGANVRGLVSSPLGRAKETAALIGIGLFRRPFRTVEFEDGLAAKGERRRHVGGQ